MPADLPVRLTCYFCGAHIPNPSQVDACHALTHRNPDGSMGECSRYSPQPWVLGGLATPEEFTRHMELLRADEALAARRCEQAGPWVSDACGTGTGF